MSLSKLRKSLFSYSNFLPLIGITLILISGLIKNMTNKPVINISKQETALNISNDILIFFSAGNKRLLTDLLWVQTLLESDTDHYKARDLNNWLFLRFNSISVLDPYFYENYLFGGQYLAIAKDDLEGANIIYSKGLSIFPDDYYLNYNAGFLNYFEIGNYKLGQKYLEKIQDNSLAPVFLKSIVNKIKLELGASLEEIFDLVMHNYLNTLDETLKRKLQGDLYRIKAEIDLKCLNSKGSGCDKKDYFGRDYIKKEGKFTSANEFIPYKIRSRKDPPSTPKSIRNR